MKKKLTEILQFLADDIKPRTFRNKSFNPMNQLLLTRFYATGNFQQLIGDSMDVHKSTVSKLQLYIALQHNDVEPPHDVAVELQQEDDVFVENVVEVVRL
ncbi:hypothetical protein RN001_012372 [Aquatica leii]|uniref:Nuclease HARBI1 n=1 Tax=Aquatica leii TaxID=1421715 RepID=A0AAN7NYE3_9COLE|nr:hypothetical protein RN001_012372 [Aquatica leii]